MYLRIGDWIEALLFQLLDGLFVIPQVEFGTNQNDGGVGTMVTHLRVPLENEERERERE